MTALINFKAAVNALLDRALGNQTALAAELGVARGTLRLWLDRHEKPLQRLPKAEKILRVLKLLGITGIGELNLDPTEFKARLANEPGSHLRSTESRNNATKNRFVQEVRCWDSNEVRCWDSNKEDYEEFIVHHMQSAAHVQIAVLCPQTESKKRYRPRELSFEFFRNRLKENKIKYQRIEVFYSLPRFINSLQDAYDFSSPFYDARFFIKPPQVMPTINLRIIDGKYFLLGSFSAGQDAEFEEKVWQIHASHPIADVLREYWRNLYSKSIPFTNSSSVDTMAIRSIFISLGIKHQKIISNIVKRAKETQYSTQVDYSRS